MRRAARAGAAAALTLALIAGFASHPRAETPEPIVLRFGDGITEAIALREWDGVEYISVNDVSRTFTAAKYWHPNLLRMDLELGGREIRLTLGNPVALVNERPVLLAGAVRIHDGVVWVPFELVANHLAPLAPQRVQWSESRRELLVGAARSNIERLLSIPRGNEDLIEIRLSKLLSHEVILEDPRTILVSLRCGILPPDPIEPEDRARIITGFEQVPLRGRALLRIRLSRDVSSVRSSASTDPPRIVVDLSYDRGFDLTVPDLFDGGGPKPRARRRHPIRTVVIDAGHGGSDLGAVGAGGLLEKEVTLEVARALRAKIRTGLGLSTVMTREEDELVPIEKRAEIANRRGDLFVSLHCNAWSDPRAGGFVTYFLAPLLGESPDGRPAGSASPDEPRFVEWDEAQVGFLEESSLLAELVTRELDRSLKIEDRGVRQAELDVLKGVEMPAVVVEMAFITNDGEEGLLGSSGFRSHVATALVRAIEQFISKRAMLDPPAAPTGGDVRIGSARDGLFEEEPADG